MDCYSNMALLTGFPTEQVGVEPNTPKGVWGYAPPGNFLKFICSEVASEAPKMLEIRLLSI